MPKKVIILGILVILWMGFIFYMSSKPGEDSSLESKKIVTFIIDKYDQLTNASNETIIYHHSYEFITKANYIFRKTCHFGEYCILGILLLSFLISLKLSLLKSYIYAILISLIYALFDEYHQTLIKGRTGMITDVLIDLSGAIFGVVLFAIIYIFVRKHHKNA